MGFRRILVGVDGSENSLLAVRWAADLSNQIGGGLEVVAVHALGLLGHIDRERERVPVEQHRAQIERICHNEWCAPLSRVGVAHRTALLYGSPVQVLLEIADEEDADLIVLGSRGLGQNPDRLLGSTSAQVVNQSHRPVVVVPLPDTRPPKR